MISQGTWVYLNDFKFHFQACTDKWEDGGIRQEGNKCPKMDSIEMEPNLSPPGQVRNC